MKSLPRPLPRYTKHNCAKRSFMYRQWPRYTTIRILPPVCSCYSGRYFGWFSSFRFDHNCRLLFLRSICNLRNCPKSDEMSGLRINVQEIEQPVKSFFFLFFFLISFLFFNFNQLLPL